MRTIPIAGFVATLLSAVCCGALAGPAGHPGPVIHGVADENRLVTLNGNVRPEAGSGDDLGAVDDAMPLTHLQLQLKRSPEREAALKQYIEDLQTPRSASYHQWLTPEQFAAHYGVAAEDVAAVRSWLISRGFTIDGVTPTGLTIEFSGTAGLVKSAFHTAIHKLSVNGQPHYANMQDPAIPAALAPAVAGVTTLHDFHPRPKLITKLPMAARPGYTYNTKDGPFHLVTPGDLATIYNLAPLFAAGYSGKGQTIMVIEDTLLYSTSDWTVFRKTFGLARAYPYGTLSQLTPSGGLYCSPPGINGDDGEAAIDVEWATAAAPNAAIVLAACGNGNGVAGFGGFVALQNVLNGPAASLPSVVSISYGEAETALGAGTNAAINALYQQAVAEGVSLFVSSGDEDGASVDNGVPATHGIGVSGFAATPYNVAVGGTDFGYTADNVDPSVYWGASNGSNYSSALSYIQEVPWNDSCAGSLLAAAFGVTPLELCKQAQSAPSGSFLNAILFQDGSEGGSGGPSGCATGAPATRNVVGGSCAGYAKPSWQSGMFGNPNDGVRDIPDVSLFASNGLWDAYYVVCYSDPSTSRAGTPTTCNGALDTWAGFGGTSVSAPIMAAIQALANQKTGSRWGNPNPVYYQLAKAEYGVAGAAGCNSTTVNKRSNGCVFYDITEGDITAACKADRSGNLHNCYLPTGGGYTYGLLSTSNTSSQPAYPSTTGWDFATGIGSVNAYNLIMSWPVP